VSFQQLAISISLWLGANYTAKCRPSTFHQIHFIDVYCLFISKERYQDSQADGGFRGASVITNMAKICPEAPDA
jgi:hypothetical protein